MASKMLPLDEITKTVDLDRRPALRDNLLDRDCAYLDGKCNCEIPEADCKYSGKPFPISWEDPKKETEYRRKLNGL